MNHNKGYKKRPEKRGELIVKREKRKGEVRRGRRGEGRRQSRDEEKKKKRWIEGKGQEDKKEGEKQSSDGVIALQRRFDKQHLRASVVK